MVKEWEELRAVLKKDADIIRGRFGDSASETIIARSYEAVLGIMANIEGAKRCPFCQGLELCVCAKG